MSTDIITEAIQRACAQCGAVLDDRQRYCVVCGTTTRHPDDPVARWLAEASARRLRANRAPEPTAPARSHDAKWIAGAFALLPVAAAIGVMAGGNGAGDGSGADAKLLAALRASPAAATAGASDAGATISSDFSLEHGYVVELQSLPGAGTTLADIRKAEAAAKAKGADAVGVINPADFVLKPATSGYVVYSGEFKARRQADRALRRLRRTFPKAKVVHVGSASAGTGTAASGKQPSTAVALQQHATTAQKKQGAQIVQQIQAAKGKSYVQQQRKLPDTIVVP